jgi:hypothetical protein
MPWLIYSCTRASSTQWIGGWVGTKAGLDALKKKMFAPAMNWILISQLYNIQPSHCINWANVSRDSTKNALCKTLCDWGRTTILLWYIQQFCKQQLWLGNDSVNVMFPQKRTCKQQQNNGVILDLFLSNGSVNMSLEQELRSETVFSVGSTPRLHNEENRQLSFGVVIQFS